MSKSRATLASDITTNLPDNTAGQITPEILRTQLQDIVDAVPNNNDEPPVLTVAGRAGTVTLTKTDVGLANVDNTADTAKPVSTAQAAADSAVASAAASDATTKANAAQAAAISTASSDATSKANAAQAAAIAASVPTSYLDTDGTLAANSDTKVATQKAVKTYADTKESSQTAASQAEAEAGSETAVRKFSPLRIAQAIAALIAPSIFAATAKTTPVDADTVAITDSAASNVLKKLTWANLKATLKTYFDTLYIALTGNNAFTGINNFSKIPSWAWVDLAGGTALTNGVPYFDAISAIRTLTFTTAAPNGTTAANWCYLRLTVTGTVVLTIPSCIRVGSSSATPITSLTLTAGPHTLVWQYENGAWYLTDTIPTLVDLTSGITGALPVANGGTGATTAAGAADALGGPETTVASATTTDLGAVTSPLVSITGTTTITGFGTVAAGTRRQGRFTGALTLTHNATSLILPGGANITTAAGDRFMAVSLGSGNWVVYWYARADGKALVSSGYVISHGCQSGTNLAASTTLYCGWNATGVNSTQGRYKIPIPVDGTLDGFLFTMIGNASGGDSGHNLTIDAWINNTTSAGSTAVASSTMAGGGVVQVSGIGQAVSKWNGSTNSIELRVVAPAGMTTITGGGNYQVIFIFK